MREIKFRAWDKKGKRIYEVHDLVLNNYYNEQKDLLLHSEDIILMQFTGLLDKNGKEIYEDDIIWWGKYDEGEKITRSVEWINTPYTACFDFGASPPCHMVEVIGNIHENPELLEV